jgi:hypothetical protein
MLPKFVKVFPHEFKRVLRKKAQHETVIRHAPAPELRPVSIGAANG